MLWTIVAILIVLWLLGLLGHVAGGFIHLLLVIAVIGNCSIGAGKALTIAGENCRSDDKS